MQGGHELFFRSLKQRSPDIFPTLKSLGDIPHQRGKIIRNPAHERKFQNLNLQLVQRKNFTQALDAFRILRMGRAGVHEGQNSSLRGFNASVKFTPMHFNPRVHRVPLHQGSGSFSPQPIRGKPQFAHDARQPLNTNLLGPFGLGNGLGFIRPVQDFAHNGIPLRKQHRVTSNCPA